MLLTFQLYTLYDNFQNRHEYAASLESIHQFVAQTLLVFYFWHGSSGFIVSIISFTNCKIVSEHHLQCLLEHCTGLSNQLHKYVRNLCWVGQVRLYSVVWVGWTEPTNDKRGTTTFTNWVLTTNKHIPGVHLARLHVATALGYRATWQHFGHSKPCKNSGWLNKFPIPLKIQLITNGSQPKVLR